MKLEAEEIGDKEAEESPVDDEEEEEINEESNSLLDKEKRKEKIKHLLQIKKRKSSKEKENESKEPGENQSPIEELVYENKSQIKETATESLVDGKVKENEISGNASNDEDTEINEEPSEPIERAHTISDDSNRLESDVDELNLLQKLHSENEMNTSTIESTDTDTPIDISESLSSEKEKDATDVISIENSSYSESEINKAVDNNHVKEILPIDNSNLDDDILPTRTTSTEYRDLNDAEVQNYVPQTSNDEYNDPIGNILLASSEDELDDKNDNNSVNDETSMNLQDDALSIGDTVVQEIAPNNTQNMQTECKETNKNYVNESTEQLAQDSTASSCGDDVVLEKQGKPDSDAIGDTIDIFSSFDKNSEESVASVKSVDQIEEQDNETIQKEYTRKKTKTNDDTDIISDSNSLEMVNVSQSKVYNNDVNEDIVMPEAEENTLNNAKDFRDSELTAVVQSNKEKLETDNAQRVKDLPMEIVEIDVVLKDTAEVEKSNITGNIAALDSVLTKDDTKVSNLGSTEDSLDALLEELHSDFNSNK